MCATNPKKKRQYVTNKKEAATTKAATTTLSKADDDDNTSAVELIYQHVGNTLLAKANGTPQSTAELLKGKDLVGFYFGASWCPYSKDFTPKLLEFYQHAATANKMEIVYVSSDNTQTEFNDYYGEMPWLAMDGDQAGARLKHNLATKLSVFKVPAFVILNVQTGHFVTDQAKQEIVNLTADLDGTSSTTVSKEGDAQEEGEAIVTTTGNQERHALLATQGKELIESWKTRNPEPLGTQDSTMDTLARGLAYLAKNPVIAIAAVCLFAFTNTIQRMMDNPLLFVAFWLIFKKMAQESLSRNEPYMAQTAAPPAPEETKQDETESKKDN